MDEKTRQLVTSTLRAVHEAAYRSVLAELALLPTEERQAVEDSIEEFMTCLGRQFEGTVQPEAAMQRLAALIYGHPAPQAVEAMERYAGALNDLLVLSRNRLISAGGPRDH